MRILVGDSNGPGSAKGRGRQDAVMCRLGRKQGIRLTLVNEGDVVALRIRWASRSVRTSPERSSDTHRRYQTAPPIRVRSARRIYPPNGAGQHLSYF